jgi:hypothetical protein
MVVVSMTSWVKRIGFVKRVVESFMDNTIKPDRVYLNLSKTEFDNAGVQLPKDLVDYFNSDERLIINWVNGENTKSMKKVFPILEYLNDDDIIIAADDDILFPTDLIESRLNDFNKFGKKYAITSNQKIASVFNDVYVASAVSLYTKRMLKNWDKYVDVDIIHTYNDDRTYLYMLWFNGFLNKPCTRYNIDELVMSYSLNIDDSGLTKNKQITIGKKYDIVANKRLKKMTNKDIKDMFGFLSDKIKHDCVMVYGKSGIDSQEMTCGEHLEMEYVIASLKKYCSSWVGRIFIVGSEPPERVKDDVIHIPCDNPYTHCKDANIIHKLRYACENIPDLSDDFLMISDDQIVTKESFWEDMKPRVVRMYSDWTEEKWRKNRKVDFWHECLYKTLNLFPKDKVAFWEPHIWSPINKYKFIEMCKKYNYKKDICCISQSLYYNFIGENITKLFDHLYLGMKNAKREIARMTIDELPRHLAWTDAAFEEKRFRDILDVIVGFNENIPIKNDVININIQNIREGIKNGTIVKEYNYDGSYVWRKLRK